MKRSRAWFIITIISSFTLSHCGDAAPQMYPAGWSLVTGPCVLLWWCPSCPPVPVALSNSATLWLLSHICESGAFWDGSSVSPSPWVWPAGWLAEQTPPTPTLPHGSVPFQSWRPFWGALRGSLSLPFMALLPPANAIYLQHGFKSLETTAKEGNIYWQVFAVHPAATFPQTRKPEISRERKNIRRTIIKTSRNGIHPHMW